MKVKIHVRFQNLSSVRENITSKLAETDALEVQQHCCLNMLYIIAEKLVWSEA
jgi:hypothetical protein